MASQEAFLTMSKGNANMVYSHLGDVGGTEARLKRGWNRCTFEMYQIEYKYYYQCTRIHGSKRLDYTKHNKHRRTLVQRFFHRLVGETTAVSVTLADNKTAHWLATAHVIVASRKANIAESPVFNEKPSYSPGSSDLRIFRLLSMQYCNSTRITAAIK